MNIFNTNETIGKLINEGYYPRLSGASICHPDMHCDCCDNLVNGLIGIEDGKDIKNDKWLCVDCFTKLCAQN